MTHLDFLNKTYPIKGTNSNSDHKNFPCGVGCMVYKKTKGGLLYTPNIHTPKDVEAKNENICFIEKHMRSFFAALEK